MSRRRVKIVVEGEKAEREKGGNGGAGSEKSSNDEMKECGINKGAKIRRAAK